jgi:putative FmdB family regulatory protein
MPIYEYRCNACEHEFEMLQKIGEKSAVTCPVCDGEVKKLISQSAFHLKGSGWYATDFSGKKNSAASESASGD